MEEDGGRKSMKEYGGGQIWQSMKKEEDGEGLRRRIEEDD